jgi:hypothetical protein
VPLLQRFLNSQENINTEVIDAYMENNFCYLYDKYVESFKQGQLLRACVTNLQTMAHKEILRFKFHPFICARDSVQ